MMSAASPGPVHSFADFIQLRSLRATVFRLNIEDAGKIGVFLISALRSTYTKIVIEYCGVSYFNLYCLAAPPDRLNLTTDSLLQDWPQQTAARWCFWMFS